MQSNTKKFYHFDNSRLKILNNNKAERFFGKSFFQSLIIGLLTGIISGYISGIYVGKYLYNFQNSIEEKQYQRRIDKEISTALEYLKYQNIEFQVVKINDIKVPPERFSTFAEAIKNYPVSFWLEFTSRYKKELSLIKRFQKEYVVFTNKCNELDGKLSYLVRQYNANAAKYPVIYLDSYTYKYFVGKLNKFSDVELQPFFDFNGIPDWVKNGYKEINQHPELRKIKKEYNFEKSQLTTILDSLKTKLNS